MDPASPAAGGAHAERRYLALADFLEHLHIAPGGSVVQVGDQELRFDPWLVDRLVGKPGEGNGGTAGLRDLLTEGVAFLAKCDRQLERLASGRLPAPRELEEFLDELVTDVAVGLALQRDVQGHVDRRVIEGRVAEARHLTDFRNRIVHGVAGLKALIGRESIARAEELVPEMIACDVTVTRVKTPLREEEVARPTQLKRDVAHGRVEHVEVRARQQSRLRPMLLILAMLLVGYGVLQAVLHSAKPGPPALEASAFANVEIVARVVARPPSLFVTVDAAKWSAMSERERLATLDEIASVAAVAKYQGVHVTATDGVAVGQWLRKRGARLLDEAPDGFAGS